MEFKPFGKIARLSRDIVITEKIDGTNTQVYIVAYKTIASDSQMTDTYIDHMTSNAIKMENPEDRFNPYFMFAGSRKRWLDCSSSGDNYGFAKWVKANAEDLMNLGEGRHFGEWYGKGIQRNYGLEEKRFALFNVGRWHKMGDNPRLKSVDPKTKKEKYTDEAPECCEVVPILYKGMFDTRAIDMALEDLKRVGSEAVKGFMRAEGLVVFHKASGQLFKKTILNDEKPKGLTT